MTPSQTARWVGLVTIGAIIVVLAVFLAITWLRGDPTNDREENQPSPSPSTARLVPISWPGTPGTSSPTAR